MNSKKKNQLFEKKKSHWNLHFVCLNKNENISQEYDFEIFQLYLDKQNPFVLLGQLIAIFEFYI